MHKLKVKVECVCVSGLPNGSLRKVHMRPHADIFTGREASSHQVGEFDENDLSILQSLMGSIKC